MGTPYRPGWGRLIAVVAVLALVAAVLMLAAPIALGGQPNQPSGLQAPPPVAPDPGASAPQPDGKAAPPPVTREPIPTQPPNRHTIAAGPVVGTTGPVERTRGGNGGVRPGRADVGGVDGGVVPDRED